MQLSAATYSFLEDLASHNDKAWFDANRAGYDAARGEILAFLAALKTALEPLEPALRDQQPKDLLFRIYRDVRFSKDKRPFKTHFGAYFSRGGRKWDGGGYYLHIEPGNSFAAAGVWMPQAALLKGIRQEIDYNQAELEAILHKPSFRKLFPKLEGEALSRPPQGYAADHPALAYLKQKSFLVTHQLSDASLQSKNAMDTLASIYREAQPLLAFLNRATEG